MSISGINSAAASSIYANISSEKVSSNLTQAAQNLESILESEGIDQETQDAIQEELAAAIAELLAASNGEMPSCEEMKATIDSIFSKYGLDAEEMLGSRLPGGGMPPQETDSDQMKTLLDILAEEKEGSEESTSLQQLAEELSQLIMDYMVGIDEEA